MRIDSINRVYEIYSAQATIAASKTVSVDSKDKVALSNQAKDFSKIKRMLSDVPDIRQSKIDGIKEKMASGNYNISAKKVADKIFEQSDIEGLG